MFATVVETFPQGNTLYPPETGTSEALGERWRQNGSCGSRKLWMKTLVVPVMSYVTWSKILNSLSLGFLICKMGW